MKTFVIILLVRVVVSSSLEVTTEHGTLTLEDHEKRSANTHVRGTFHSHSGDGIKFISTPDYLRVVTTDGETLVEASSLSASIQTYGGDGRAAYFRILGKPYAEIDGQQTYSLPELSAATLQSALDRVQLTQLLARLQAEPIHPDRVQAAVQESVERLVAHPAVRLLEPASQALGEDLEVTGMDHPASLPFHFTAMQLTEARMKSREVDVASYYESWKFYYPGLAKTQAYPNCNLRTCPPCRSDECIGLCGRRCTCWRWVCNDCCLHRGCLQHDLCCIRRGFYSFQCLFPFGISCSTYRC